MKRFKEGIDRYWQAIMVEVRGGLTKTPLHILKTVVIFFIPFFYAFTYLWAFYDPIGKADDLNLTIVTSKDDALGEFVKSETVNKGIEIHNGPNVNIKAHLHQIYAEDVDGTVDSTNDVVKDSLLTVNVPNLDQIIVEAIRDAITTRKSAIAGSTTYMNALVKAISTFIAGNTLNGKPTIDYNYKKNFLIGFATDISSAQSGGLNAVMSMLLDALTTTDTTTASQPINNVIRSMAIGDVDPSGVVSGLWVDHEGNIAPRSFAHHQWALAGADPAHPAVSGTDFDDFAIAMSAQLAAIKPLVSPQGGFIKNAPGTSIANQDKAIEIIRMDSQLGTDKHQDFGIGLSPFFISIGMWFGAVAMTVLIHRKIYDRKTYVKWRYMAKGTLINAGVIIQACILMLSLKFIGLDIIGSGHWAIMFGTAIFAGIVFATFIMAIRLSIPSRALSIYIVVIFMVLNIVCSGGLFPIQTQNSFVRAMNTWLPMHFSVEMLRQGLIDTNWSIWAENFGYLSIYLLFVPMGVGLNLVYTHRWYLRYNYRMPEHMRNYHQWWLKRHPKKNAAIAKHLRESGKNLKKGGDI